MPFPLAHPAAVLPFRRYCPRFFNFPALVFGSLAPDLSYCLGMKGLDAFAHRFTGSFGFSLPVGLVSLWIFYRLRIPLVRALPERYRQLFLPLCQRPAGPLLAIILSLLVGAWTHILVDSVSHRDGWLVVQTPWLQQVVGSFLGHKVTIYQVAWFSCTAAGVGWLGLAYLKWLQKVTGAAHLTSWKVRLGYAFVMTVLTVLLGLVHRLLHHPLELYPVVAGMVLLAVGFVVGIGNRIGVTSDK